MSGVIPGPLAGSVRGHSHEGTVLRIAPVFAPVPPPLVGLLAGGVSLPLGAVLFVLVARLGGPTVDPSVLGNLLLTATAATALACGLLGTWATYRLTIRAVVLEVGTTRLRVRHEGGRARELDLPLTSIRGIEVSGRALVITTDTDRHRVPIAGRSERTREALADLVAELRDRQEARVGDAGDVPADLRDLRQRERE